MNSTLKIGSSSSTQDILPDSVAMLLVFMLGVGNDPF